MSHKQQARVSAPGGARRSSSDSGITQLFAVTRSTHFPFHIVNVGTRRLRKAVDPIFKAEKAENRWEFYIWHFREAVCNSVSTSIFISSVSWIFSKLCIIVILALLS